MIAQQSRINRKIPILNKLEFISSANLVLLIHEQRYTRPGRYAYVCVYFVEQQASNAGIAVELIAQALRNLE